jgi:hypothetical protein
MTRMYTCYTMYARARACVCVIRVCDTYIYIQRERKTEYASLRLMTRMYTCYTRHALLQCIAVSSSAHLVQH